MDKNLKKEGNSILLCCRRKKCILDIIRTWVVKLTFFEKLLKCSLCTGFWVGVVVGSYIFPVETKEFWFFAFASSAICWLYDSIVGMVQAIDAHFE